MLEAAKKEAAMNIQLKTTTIRTTRHKLPTHNHSTALTVHTSNVIWPSLNQQLLETPYNFELQHSLTMDSYHFLYGL